MKCRVTLTLFTEWRKTFAPSEAVVFVAFGSFVIMQVCDTVAFYFSLSVAMYTICLSNRSHFLIGDNTSVKHILIHFNDLHFVYRDATWQKLIITFDGKGTIE